MLKQQTVLFVLQCYCKTTTVNPQANSQNFRHCARRSALQAQEVKDHWLLDVRETGREMQFHPELPSEGRGPPSPFSSVTPVFPQHSANPLQAFNCLKQQ